MVPDRLPSKPCSRHKWFSKSIDHPKRSTYLILSLCIWMYAHSKKILIHLLIPSLERCIMHHLQRNPDIGGDYKVSTSHSHAKTSQKICDKCWRNKLVLSMSQDWCGLVCNIRLGINYSSCEVIFKHFFSHFDISVPIIIAYNTMTERDQNEHEQEMTKDTIPNRNGKMYEIYSALFNAFQQLLSCLTHSLFQNSKSQSRKSTIW